MNVCSEDKPINYLIRTGVVISSSFTPETQAKGDEGSCLSTFSKLIASIANARVHIQDDGFFNWVCPLQVTATIIPQSLPPPSLDARLGTRSELSWRQRSLNTDVWLTPLIKEDSVLGGLLESVLAVFWQIVSYAPHKLSVLLLANPDRHPQLHIIKVFRLTHGECHWALEADSATPTQWVESIFVINNASVHSYGGNLEGLE